MKNLLKHPLIRQIIKFGAVGVLCFLIEYCLLILLKEKLGLSVLYANAFAFTVSVTVNYILSMLFVFEADQEQNRVKRFVVFVLLSIGGLGINQGVMFWGTKLLDPLWSRSYILVKPFATGVVMVYNFVTRKLFIEKKKNEKADESIPA